MNKKLLTLAVAGALAAPVAAMADATLYGKIHQSIDYFDIDDGFDGWTLNRGSQGAGASRSNRIGVKGSEDLGGGLKAIYQIEFGVNLADQDSDSNNGDSGSVKMRNTFAGLASDWGTLLVGRHDTPLKISTGKLDMFADTMADYNGTVGFQDVRADNAIAYISPNFSGFQLAAATVPGSHTISGVSNPEADSIADGWSVAGIYKNGPFYGSLAYEQFGEDMLAVEDPMTPGAIIVPDNNFNKWRIGLGLLDWNGFTLSGVYEDHENVGGADDAESDFWQIQAGYAFGNNMVKGMYGAATLDGATFERDDLDFSLDLDGDKSTWALGVDHNFSKRTKAYVLYTDVDVDDEATAVLGPDWSGFSVGMIHKF